MKRRNVTCITALLLIFIMLFSACGAEPAVTITATPIASVASTPSATDAETPKPTDSLEPTPAPTPKEPITLKLWTTWVQEQGKSDPTAEFITNFEKKNPDIKIEKTMIAWADLRTTITPALKSGEGPDVFNYTPGPGYVGVMAKAGMLLDISSAVSQFGWDKIFPSWYFNEHKVDGVLYGMSNSETLLGTFYNKKLFADAGVTIPNTYEELLTITKTFKDKGITPISVPLKDQWQSFHYTTMFFGSFVGADIFFEAEKTSKGFDGSAFIMGLQAFQDLVKDGYATKDPNGVAYADAINEFKADKSAMFFTGTWLCADLYNTMKDNVGFFTLPPKSGVEPGLTGGTGDEFLISATTKYPAESLRLVDAIVTDPKLWATAYLPISKVDDLASLGLTPLQQEVYAIIMSATGIAPIVDVYMSLNFNEAVKTTTQKLVAGKITAEEMAKELQKVLDSDTK